MVTVDIPFQGFYQTIHSDVFDRFIELETENLAREDLEPHQIGDELQDAINYRQAFQKYAEDYAEFFAELLTELSGEVVTFHEVKLISPREYNFTTDRIEVKMHKDAFLAICRDITTEEFRPYVEEHLRPRDGFSPFYSNNLDDWGPFSKWDHAQRSLALAFYFEKYDEADDNEEHFVEMYVDVYEQVSPFVDWDKVNEFLEA